MDIDKFVNTSIVEAIFYEIASDFEISYFAFGNNIQLEEIKKYLSNYQALAIKIANAIYGIKSAFYEKGQKGLDINWRKYLKQDLEQKMRNDGKDPEKFQEEINDEVIKLLEEREEFYYKGVPHNPPKLNERYKKSFIREDIIRMVVPLALAYAVKRDEMKYIQFTMGDLSYEKENEIKNKVREYVSLFISKNSSLTPKEKNCLMELTKLALWTL